jgi:hypothetical protein
LNQPSLLSLRPKRLAPWWRRQLRRRHLGRVELFLAPELTGGRPMFPIHQAEAVLTAYKEATESAAGQVTLARRGLDPVGLLVGNYPLVH